MSGKGEREKGVEMAMPLIFRPPSMTKRGLSLRKENFQEGTSISRVLQ